MVKKMKKKTVLFALIAMTGVTGMFPVTSYADENGGAVQTNGVISFYEESTNSTETSSSKDSSTSTDSNSKPDTSASSEKPKPTGNYPSTGELVSKSLGISGVLLLILALLLFLKKKHRDEKGAEK